jgi:hypothetical protein
MSKAVRWSSNIRAVVQPSPTVGMSNNGAELHHRWCAETGNWPRDLGELAKVFEDTLPLRAVQTRFLRLLDSSDINHKVDLEDIEREVFVVEGRSMPDDVSDHVVRIRRELIHWHVKYRVDSEGNRFWAVELPE